MDTETRLAEAVLNYLDAVDRCRGGLVRAAAERGISLNELIAAGMAEMMLMPHDEPMRPTTMRQGSSRPLPPPSPARPAVGRASRWPCSRAPTRPSCGSCSTTTPPTSAGARRRGLVCPAAPSEAPPWRIDHASLHRAEPTS